MTDLTPRTDGSGASGSKARIAAWAAGAAVVIFAIVLIAGAVHRHQLSDRLVVTDPDTVTSHPELVRYAEALARPAYAANCASCHGADMKGDQAKGAPNLSDRIWLYDFGGVGDLERTILYGIRSGNAKSRNITDMPAFGRTLQLSPDEVRDVTTFVLSLTTRQTDTAAIERGSKIFQNKGSCYDCHSADAEGNPDYGSPAFTDKDWVYGGDEKTVYESIYSGRHGLCPAWIGKLKPAVIRALAVYIHQVSHTEPAREGHAHG